MNEPLECRRKWCFKSGDFRPHEPRPKESWGARERVSDGCGFGIVSLLFLMLGDPLGLALDSGSSSLTLDSVISGLSPTPTAAAVATSAAVPAPLWIPGISETECVVHDLKSYYCLWIFMNYRWFFTDWS